MIDEKRFAGAARFDLMLLAPLTIATIEVLVRLVGRHRLALAGVAVVWIAGNMVMSPVAIGGEKEPYWISPDTITAEFYFPKREAVTWLKENRPGYPVVLAGTLFDPGLGWYFNKLDYRPPTAFVESKNGAKPMENLRNAISSASAKRAPLVLYFRMTPGPDLSEEEKVVGNYHVAQVFRNRYLSIVLYEVATPR
jgi:hypothetical protein